jgi:hypothetical protein
MRQALRLSLPLILLKWSTWNMLGGISREIGSVTQILKKIDYSKS